MLHGQETGRIADNRIALPPFAFAGSGGDGEADHGARRWLIPLSSGSLAPYVPGIPDPEFRSGPLHLVYGRPQPDASGGRARAGDQLLYGKADGVPAGLRLRQFRVAGQGGPDAGPGIRYHRVEGLAPPVGHEADVGARFAHAVLDGAVHQLREDLHHQGPDVGGSHLPLLGFSSRAAVSS